MVLSEVEREITKNVVQRFLHENKSSPRKLLARRFRSSQAFYRLTGWNILANATAYVSTGEEEYRPRALAFYYAGDPYALRMARESVTIVVRALQNLFDAEPDKKQFTPGDLTAQVNRIVEPRPEPETVKLGLYLVRDIGILSLWSPADAIEPAFFAIAEHIVEISDFDRVWDDFIARAAPHDVSPQHAAPEIDLIDSDILITSEGLNKMAKSRRDPAPLPHHPTVSPELTLKRLQKLLAQIPEVRSSGHRSRALSVWEGNVKITLGEFYGENSLVFREFNGIWFTPGSYYEGQPDSEFEERYNAGLDEATGFLESRINDLCDTVELEIPRSTAQSTTAHHDSHRVFLVHGHDHGNKEMVARFLTTLGLDPVILHEQADRGKTVIEKFEAHAADVRCALVILTADDVAYPKSDPDKKEFRARQNVILELGYFVGKLGRAHTFALVEKGVELPSDIHGVVYIPLDDGHWRLRLVKELKAAGLDVDANLAV
jgi:predicted nucleotide-binding protein